MRWRAARHPLVTTFLAVTAIALVLGLIYAGLMVRAALSSERVVQIFLTSDARAPDRVSVGLNMNVWMPPTRTFADEPMVCDGIQLHPGLIPYTGFSGYYGDLPSSRADGVHHCVFHDWRETVALDIPAALPDFSRARISLQDGASLPLDQPIRITYQTGNDMLFYEARATDASGHMAMATSGGYGVNGGHLVFGPVGARGVQSGPGTILFTTIPDSKYVRERGWESINLVVSSGVSIPVVWT